MKTYKLPELLELNGLDTVQVPTAEVSSTAKQCVLQRRKLESIVADLKSLEKDLNQRASNEFLSAVELVKDENGTFKVSRTNQYSLEGGVKSIQELVAARLSEGMDAVEAFDPTSRLALRATYFNPFENEDEIPFGVKRVEVKQTKFTPSK